MTRFTVYGRPRVWRLGWAVMVLSAGLTTLSVPNRPVVAEGPKADEPAKLVGSAKIRTIAGSGQAEPPAARGPADLVNINQPFGVEVGPDGGLYICSVGHGRVYRLNRDTRLVDVFAGSVRGSNRGDGGPAEDTRLLEPYEIRFDPDGNAYIVDMKDARIRRVDAKTGKITTVAGNRPGFGGDGGPATAAQLQQPHSIALDGRAALYIADLGNHRIRRVDLATGVISTVAGTGEKTGPEEGPAAGKPILGPRALHIVGRTLFIALREGHSVWAMDLDSGVLTHLAGTGKPGWTDGPAKIARFNGPKGIVASANGDTVWIMDTENHAVRVLDIKAGRVSTLAGGGPKSRGFGGDGGPANAPDVLMDRPHGITVDAKGTIFVGDSNNHRVRQIGP